MTSPRRPDAADYRYEGAAAPDWRPLEQLARICRDNPRLPPLDPDQFMYMGRVTHPSRPPIHWYKHTLTRRYLNLDPAGHAYTHATAVSPARGDRSFTAVRDLREALIRVLGDAAPAPAERPPLTR